MKKYNLYIYLIIGLFIFNLVDTGATAYFVSERGTHIELNPVMRWVLERGIPLFIAVKVFIGFFASYVFWKSLPHTVLARVAVVFCFVPYFLLAAYYISYIVYLLL